MGIEYRIVCDKELPSSVRHKLMSRVDISTIEEREKGILIRVRIKEEKDTVEGFSFCYFIEGQEITVTVRSAVWFAHTEAAYLIIEAFKDSGVSFRIEDI
jgi:hypothetical protein